MKYLIAAIFMLVANPAWASCGPLKGSYRIYVTDLAYVDAGQCEIRVSKKGWIKDPVCRGREIVRWGKLALNDDCSVEGAMRLDTGRGIVTASLRKGVMSGLVLSETGPAIASFTAIRQGR